MRYGRWALMRPPCSAALMRPLCVRPECPAFLYPGVRAAGYSSQTHGESILEITAWKRADDYCTFFDSKPKVALSRIKQQMHREVGHCNMLQIVRNIQDNMV